MTQEEGPSKPAGALDEQKKPLSRNPAQRLFSTITHPLPANTTHVRLLAGHGVRELPDAVGMR